MSEEIDHPSYYNASASGIECIDVVEHLSFNIGNAIKYLWRCGMKNDPIIDLEKSLWYIKREIRRLEVKL